MHRSTRLRRLAVAFLVVLVLAVAARFARASSRGEETPSASPPIPLNNKLFLRFGQR
jgi:hypothetical protein